MGVTTRNVLKEIGDAARRSPRIYFAPLVGAIRALQSEFRQDANSRKSQSGLMRKSSR